MTSATTGHPTGYELLHNPRLNKGTAFTEAERRVIVRGSKPFKITSVRGTDEVLSVKDTTDESKPVHVLILKLKAEKPSEWSRTLRILTDLKEESEIELQAKVQIVPNDENANEEKTKEEK